MIQKTKQWLSLTLAALLLAGSLTACSTGGEDKTATGGESAAVTEAETQDPASMALDALGTVEWGGEDFVILYTNSIAGYSQEIFSEGYTTGTDTSSSAVINDAVFERNTMFAERCHLNLGFIGRDAGAVMNLVRTEASNATGDFHLVTETTSGTASMATSCLLYNYLLLDGVDYEAPWWDAGTLEFALGGRVFFMNGAHNIVDDDVTFVMLFNKKMASNYRVENPYQTVRDGDWTLDYFNTVINGISNDNGDGKWDENDTYGFTGPNTVGDTFFYGSGLQYVVNNREMVTPELALNEGQLQKAVAVLELAREITLANNASYIAPGGKESLPMEAFKSDRALFYCEAASYLANVNKVMDGDFGVVPIPKYDKNQEKYLTWTHSIGSTLSMPASIRNTEKLGGVLETFVILSYMKVKPAYYDTMLTKRNIRDADSAEMLDIIFRNRVYDMAMYFTDLGFASLFAQAAISAGGNFVSQYQSASRGFDRRLKNIMKALDKMDQ